MILRALYELYGRLSADPDYGIAPQGFSYQKITFVVVIEPNGELFNIEDARQPGERRLEPRRVLVPGGAKKTGSGLNPCFLWDNTTYLLGYDPKKPERAKKAFEAFKKRHLEAENEIDSPHFSAVCRFLESWKPQRCQEHSILEEIASGFGVFQIRGDTRYVHEDQAVLAWWEKELSSGEDPLKGQCLVTGDLAPLARLNPPIKGVSGAQSTGAAIVSFNAPAYESYGKSQSFNAPISEEVAFQYVTALNALLDGPKREKHRILVGDTTVAFWTDRPTTTEDIFALFTQEGSAIIESDVVQDEALRAKLKAFVEALRRGSERYSDIEQEPDRTKYFILGLAPNAARIAVRFFHQNTLSDLLKNLRQHFQDIAVERQFLEGASRRPDPEFPPLWLLLQQTARDKKDIPPILAGPLLEAIVTGAPYPQGLYSAVMRRITADRTVNYPRACIIKGYLVRNLGKEVPMSLDNTRIEPGYRLGRLFAALEKTQKDALGTNLSSTIRDRFYSSASATPAAVFPRLLRTYQHHLAKLEGGLKVNRERLVQEILDPLTTFPAHLDLSEQGLFALGYYHQMNDLYRSKDLASTQ